jgi:7-carboxy-7-deazaguanine synthase
MSEKNFPVLEMFCSIQGEGKFTGVPSFFVRVGGCNLRCVFGNSRCDTPYSSFELEKPTWNNVHDAAMAFGEMYEKNPNVHHIVITGGEPMLYKEQIKEFMTLIQSDEHSFTLTIETNGTLPAMGPWADDDFENWVDLWSISPKLSTSVDHNCKFLTEAQRDNHDKTRINIDSLSSYIDATFEANKANSQWGPDMEGCIKPSYQLKFVYSGEDSVKEIKEILSKLPYVNEENVMLMPEGTTNDQLDRISQECAEVCIKEGWQFCDRLHIRIWGDKRGV